MYKNRGKTKEAFLDPSFLLPSNVFSTYLPIMFGLYFVLLLDKSDIPKELVIASLAMLAVFTLNLFIKIPLVHRAILLGTLPVHLLIIKAALNIYYSKKYNSTHLATVYLFAIVIINLLLFGIDVVGGYKAGPNLSLTEKSRPNKFAHHKLEKILTEVNDGAVIMAPIKLGWPIPAIKGKVVGMNHINPLIHDHFQRRKDVYMFFNEHTDITVRKEIIKEV